MTAKKLKAAVTDVFFTLQAFEFHELRSMEFADEKSAREFLINYLVAECNFGAIHAPEDLLDTRVEIEKLLESGTQISSRDLNSRTPIEDCIFILDGKSCFIETAKPHN